MRNAILIKHHGLRARALPAILIMIVALAIGLGAGFLLGRRGPREAAQSQGAGAEGAAPAAVKTLYTCGMHPEVIQDHPGDCPKCGMKLVPMDPDRARTILEARGESVPSTGGEQASGAGPTIRIDPVTQQNMGLRYGVVRVGLLEKAIRTVGTVQYDEQSQGAVTTKVNGWIEKVIIDQAGTQVHRGDPLFELYSPELYSAQEEFLVALRDAKQSEARGQKEAASLARNRLVSARDRLRLFDISEAQIQTLEKEQKVQKTMTITAQLTGIVTHKNIVEGDHLKAGMPAYQIADLSTVWVIGKVYESDLPFVRLGQEAQMKLDYLPGRVYSGRVTYVYPYLEPGTREIPVRMEFHNPGYELKPGMYATIELRAKLEDEAILVPATAVINTGERQVAFVTREAGKFEPRRIVTGARTAADELQVLSGLAPGEKVVVSGQFLLDSESRLREATLKMLEPGMTGMAETKEGSEHDEHAAMGHEMHGVSSSAPREAKYVCPMPSHAAILYDEPGNCPLCEMRLVPVQPWQTEQSPIDHWTCPMPEDYDVRETGPGKCPKCGMTLIPVTQKEMERFQTPMTPMPEDMKGMPGMTDTEEKTPAAPVLYTCPMASHADVVSDQPGDCPKCGMKLVPTSEVAHGKQSEEKWREAHPHQ